MELTQSQINFWRAVCTCQPQILSVNIDSRAGIGKVGKMVTLTAKLEAQLQSPGRLSRNWISIKSALKSDQIKSLLDHTQQIEVTLILARQTSFE